jgi:hypothetical protein
MTAKPKARSINATTVIKAIRIALSSYTSKKEQFEQEFFSSPSYWWENRVERVMNMKPVAISLVDRRKNC